MEQINNDSSVSTVEQTNDLDKLKTDSPELVSNIINTSETENTKVIEKGILSSPDEKFNVELDGVEFITMDKRLNWEDSKNFMQSEGKQLLDKYELDNLFKRYKEVYPERQNHCGVVSDKNPLALFCDMYWSSSEVEDDKQQAFIECFVYGMSFATDKNNSYRIMYK